MKVSTWLHRVTEIDAEAWIFKGNRPTQIRRACDALTAVGITAAAFYVLDLLLHAIAWAIANP